MRVTKPPQERRDELVAAARALFDEKGVDRTRVSDIVRRVGVAQGAFYYYFASKDEVVEVVARQVGAELDAAAGAVVSDMGRPFAQKLAALIELYLDLVDKFTGDDATHLPEPDDDLWAAGFTPGLTLKLNQYLRQLVEAGAKAGEVTAAFPWHTAQVLIYGLRHLAQHQLPTRQMIYAMTEQALGLKAGSLTAQLPKATGPGKKAKAGAPHTSTQTK